MAGISTAADAFSSIVSTQQALDVLTMINLVASFNPFDGYATNKSEFDYIVVGGGTSGSVVASRLSEDSHVSVLLIEAGGDFQIQNDLPGLNIYNKGSRLDWNYPTAHDGNFVICHDSSVYYPLLGKVLGGSSSVDLMLYSQGEDRVYNSWADLTGERSWRFDNVLILFKKIEKFHDTNLQRSYNNHYHGFEGKVGLTKDHSVENNKYFKALNQVGHKIVRDINAINRLGYSGATYYIADNKRQSSAYAYLYPARDRPNLVVLKHTQVIKILFDEQKNAIGVRAVSLKTNQTFEFKTKREVILAAGTLNTPKLLQLSGIGPRDLLESKGVPVLVNSPNVGYNYHNHVGINIVYATKPASETYDLHKVNPHEFPCPALEGCVSLNKSNTYADYRTLSFIVPHSPAVLELYYNSFLHRYRHDITDHWNTRSANREMFVTILHSSKVHSRGMVRIWSSDPFDPPIIQTGYLSNDEDFKELVKYAQDFTRVMQSDEFKRFGAVYVDPSEGSCGLEPAGSEAYWRCYISCMMAPLGDHVGTAALGPVVDGRLRVHGVRNLRVADASIIPELFTGSIAIPTMMIGENAAELIKADWSEK